MTQFFYEYIFCKILQYINFVLYYDLYELTKLLTLHVMIFDKNTSLKIMIIQKYDR